MGPDERIVNVNEYALQASVEDYRAAITALARRTEMEGHPGVGQYLWYAADDAATAGALVTYVDAEAWLAHHQMAYEWPEMAALQATVSLSRLTVFGPLTAAVEEWINGAGLTYTHYAAPVAGFARAVG